MHTDQQNSKSARPHHDTTGSVVVAFGPRRPRERKYFQSTSGRSASQGTRPSLSRSSAMTSDSESLGLTEIAFRRYPRDVPQRLAKAVCSGLDSEFRNRRRTSISRLLPSGTIMSIPKGMMWFMSCLPRRKQHYNVDVTAPNNTLERLYETRRKRAKQLKSEFVSLVEFAARIDQSPSYTSRMLQTGKNRKNIGEEMARRIEHLCGKPSGWLDIDEDARTTGRSNSKEHWPFNFPRQEWEELSQVERRAAEQQFRIFLAIEKEKKRARKKVG